MKRPSRDGLAIQRSNEESLFNNETFEFVGNGMFQIPQKVMANN
jgi:hypothetical protein